MYIANKAIVLAAGLGTRLRPLTCVVPKPLLPVWGESMLARTVAMLRERGVKEIAVNCHYLNAQVESWCAENGIKVSYEPEILGTGGVLNPLRDWIGNDDFYLVNGDVVIENAPQLKFDGDDTTIVVAAVSDEGPRTIEVEPESRYVTCWRSPDPGWPGTCTYCGFALLKASILNYVKPDGFSSIVEAYEKAMMDGKFVKAVASEDMLWTDAGTIESYIAINSDGDDNAFADIPQLKKALGENYGGKIEFIGARGSDRIFFRADDKVVVIYDDAKRGENARYAAHARWLAERGVKVPALIADLPEMKTLVFENAGVDGMKLQGYVKVAEALAEFNKLDAAGIELEPPMDAAMWRWERELFREHCLEGHFGLEMPADVEAELERVANMLLAEPMALVHRDFQTTNVLWRNGDFKFIDFQGMRLGPAVYDLASLVYDPYVKLSERERAAIVKVYADATARGGEISAVLPFAAVERLVQCLGAYGRLASVGQGQFKKYILPALENLLAAADEAGLDAIGALAEELIHLETENGKKSTHQHHCNCR